MNAEEIKNRTGTLIKRLYRSSEREPLPETFVLLGEGGILDSVAMLELIVGIEREFGVTVQSEDICPENFRDVECISRFILRSLP
jgi:acyl carrier protein